MIIKVDVLLLAVNETNSLLRTLSILKKNREIRNILIISPNFATQHCLDIQKKVKKKNKKIKSYIQPKKYPGIGGAIIFGSKKIKSKNFVIVNADGETDPYTVKKMISFLKKNHKVDIISASRFLNKKLIDGYGIINSLLTFSFQVICRNLFSNKITDYTVNYRMYKTNVFKSKKFYFYDQSFALESLLAFINPKFVIKEVSFVWKKRTEGSTENNFFNKLKYFKPLFFYLLKQNNTK